MFWFCVFGLCLVGGVVLVCCCVWLWFCFGFLSFTICLTPTVDFFPSPHKGHKEGKGSVGLKGFKGGKLQKGRLRAPLKTPLQLSLQ